MQKNIIFAFVCALPCLLLCFWNEKLGYILAICVFLFWVLVGIFPKILDIIVDIIIGFWKLFQEIFIMDFDKWFKDARTQIILSLLGIIGFILFGSIIFNVNFYFENKELQRKIPHEIGIGGDIVEPIKKEKDYVKEYCHGNIEYKLPDMTRVDCVQDGYAIEFDWGKKWAESIGQSLYYAKATGLKPAVAIIMKSPNDERYIERIQRVDKDITIFRIKAYDEAKPQ